jgi:hypothetical protein
MPGVADIVTAATLAGRFGVTARAVGDLVCRDVIERRAGGFNLEDSTRRATTHYRNLAQGRGGEVDVGKAAHQRARAAKAQAELVETKGRKLRGELSKHQRSRPNGRACCAPCAPACSRCHHAYNSDCRTSLRMTSPRSTVKCGTYWLKSQNRLWDGFLIQIKGSNSLCLMSCRVGEGRQSRA